MNWYGHIIRANNHSTIIRQGITLSKKKKKEKTNKSQNMLTMSLSEAHSETRTLARRHAEGTDQMLCSTVNQ